MAGHPGEGIVVIICLLAGGRFCRCLISGAFIFVFLLHFFLALLAELLELVFLFLRKDAEHLLVRLFAQLLHLVALLVIAERAVFVYGPRLFHHLLMNLAKLLFLLVSQIELLCQSAHALSTLHSAHASAAMRMLRLRL